MAFVLIFELGIIFFVFVLICAGVIAITALVCFGLNALHKDRLEDLVFAVVGALFLASGLLILVGAIVIALT